MRGSTELGEMNNASLLAEYQATNDIFRRTAIFLEIRRRSGFRLGRSFADISRLAELFEGRRQPTPRGTQPPREFVPRSEELDRNQLRLSGDDLKFLKDCGITASDDASASGSPTRRGDGTNPPNTEP